MYIIKSKMFTFVRTTNNNLHMTNYDDILKLKAAALYIINKFDQVDILTLFKVLYFADREHFAKFGRRIINDTFISMSKGPVPSDLYDAIKILRKEPKQPSVIAKLEPLTKAIELADPEFSYIVSAREKADMDELSKSDIECLDKSYEENKSLGVKELSTKSHDIAWRKSYQNCPNTSIDPLDIALAGGASDAMLKYIKENLLLEEALNS